MPHSLLTVLLNNKKHLTSAESSRHQFSYSMFTQLIRFVAVARTVFRMMILEDICPLETIVCHKLLKAIHTLWMSDHHARGSGGTSPGPQSAQTWSQLSRKSTCLGRPILPDLHRLH